MSSRGSEIEGQAVKKKGCTVLNPETDERADVLVRVENVSKKFCRDLKRSLWYGVCDIASELRLARSQNGSELRHEEFWGVNDVSFIVRRGECLGLIGRNGAGKTTLLKLLHGLIKPDKGKVEIRGRVGALIGLGAGFNPVLTGRENIYINGSVLGLTKKELSQKIDEIIEFAELGNFIDSPVQSYSSGMQVRLGFAVATAVEPDVLLLDEILAVGDASFRAKCFERIGRVTKDTAVIFVSHDQSQVARLCDWSIVLDHGNEIFSGLTMDALAVYTRLFLDENTLPQTKVLGESVSDFALSSPPVMQVDAGKSLTLMFALTASSPISVGMAIINFLDVAGTPAGQVDFTGYIHFLPEGRSEIELSVQRVELAAGNYTLNIAIFAADKRQTLVHIVNLATVHVAGKPFLWCAYKMSIAECKLKQASTSGGEAT